MGYGTITFNNHLHLEFSHVWQSFSFEARAEAVAVTFLREQIHYHSTCHESSADLEM